MKSVLISIRPKWCEKIASGDKTIEVRKTRPKMETPFKCYIYCTKPSKAPRVICGSHILSNDELYDELYRHPQDGIKYGGSIELMLRDDCTESNFLNGKIIGEFTCDEFIEFPAHSAAPACYAQFACMAPNEIHRYLGNKDGYGWHISGLKIYDKPRELDWLRKPLECHRGNDRENCVGCWDCEIKRPPQSWCYVAEG